MLKRNSHCSYCGHAFEENQSWPRTCTACNSTSFINPLPVAVLLVPCDGGLLTVRRGIEPKKGMLALPGGYINLGETWQQAGVREVLEETGITLAADSVEDFRVLSAPDGTVLVFGLAPEIPAQSLSVFTPCDEATELVVLKEPGELAFPLHTRVANEFFAL